MVIDLSKRENRIIKKVIFKCWIIYENMDYIKRERRCEICILEYFFIVIWEIKFMK